MECKHCGKELKADGLQYDPIRSVVYTLASCTTPECVGYMSTFSGDVRPMDEAELDKYAAFRAKFKIGRANYVYPRH